MPVINLQPGLQIISKSIITGKMESLKHIEIWAQGAWQITEVWHS